MNTILKYVISFVIFFVAFLPGIFAQQTKYLGFDISKTITNKVFTKGNGFVLEPLYVVAVKNSNLKLKSHLGYAMLKKTELYKNSDMTTQGIYLKQGLGYSKTNDIVPYLNLFASSYKIKNTYTLKGNYFNDYSKTYNHGLFAMGIEANVDLIFNIHPRLILMWSVHAGYVLVNTEKNTYPVYYIPGAGVVNNNNYSLGINISILFTKDTQ